MALLPDRQLLAGAVPSDRGTARHTEAPPRARRGPVGAVVNVADLDGGRLRALKLPPVGVLAVPGEARALVGRGWETLRELLAGDLDLHVDPLHARGEARAAERGLERVRGFVAGRPAALVVEREGCARNRDGLAQGLVLGLDDGAALPVTVVDVAAALRLGLAGTFSVVLRGTAQVPFSKDPMAKVKANVNVTIPSAPVLITVLPKTVATVAVTPPAAAAKIGTQAEVVFKVTRQFEYDGEFKVELVQPANAKGITCDAVTIPPGKDEAKLILKVAEDAPPGNRADLIVRATAMIAGKPAAHDAKLAVNVTK